RLSRRGLASRQGRRRERFEFRVYGLLWPRLARRWRIITFSRPGPLTVLPCTIALGGPGCGAATFGDATRKFEHERASYTLSCSYRHLVPCFWTWCCRGRSP